MSPATVLLVEDDDATAYWVQRVLVRSGSWEGEPPRVIQVATLDAAVEALTHGSVCCVLLDLALPDSSGLESFLAVRRAARGAPIVVLTARADEELGAEAVRHGAQDFLDKSSPPEQISRAVRFALLRARWQGAVDEAARLEAVLDGISDAYLMVDHAGRVTYVNRAAEGLFQVRRDEVVGRALEAAFPALVGTRVGAALLRGVPAELDEYLPAVARWVEARLSPSPQGTTAYLRDHTARTIAENELREAQRFTASLLANLPGMVYRSAYEPGWRVLFASEGALALTGYPPERFLGEGALAYGELIHPDDRDWVWREAREAVEQARVFEIRYRIIAADGTEKWVWEQGRGVPDADGVTRVVEGFIADVTLHKELEDQLRLAQKLDAVGRLAGGIAHDFNNLLTAIKGTVSLMLLDMDPESSLREDAEAINDAVNRAAGLARQLLAFGRGHLVRRDTLDLNSVVHDTARLLRRLIPAEIELDTALADTLPPVMADGGQMEQVVMNLVLNARDAMPASGGRVIVETMRVEVDESPRGWATGLRSGEYVMLVVHDTGAGMSEATQEHIFEPFFTTKEVGKGTGLGLSVVYGIVQQCGGAIRVFSRPGTGTTFRILLPPADGAKKYPRPWTAEPALELQGVYGGTVLVADDEPAVRRTTRRLLERAGFDVLDAADGEEALRAARAHPGRIDLLLTDVVMPRMSGPELAAHFVRERPSTPVLFVSGYSPGDAFVAGDSAERQFLHKPFTAAALAEAVARALRRAGDPVREDP